MIVAETLAAENLRHGFFTRAGGHSTGIYESLNAGLGTGDDTETVLKNRAEVAAHLRIAPHMLVSPYQHHSADVAIAADPWDAASRPKADAVVTKVPGLAVAVTTADCTPVLFCDAVAGVVGAAHSGWKGALAGVLEETVNAMEALGAKKGRIQAAIGPTISQSAYEVGPEFFDRFLEVHNGYERFFRPSERDGHHQFDLPGFVGARLKDCGVARVEDLQICTYSDEARYFSYRRATHRGEVDYGCQIAAITIAD